MLIIWMVKIRNDSSDDKTWKYQIPTKCWVSRSRSSGRWRGRIGTRKLEPETTQSHQLGFNTSDEPLSLICPYYRELLWDWQAITLHIAETARQRWALLPSRTVHVHFPLFFTWLSKWNIGRGWGRWRFPKNSISKVKRFTNIIDIS